MIDSKQLFFTNHLTDPATQAPLKTIDQETLIFENGTSYPLRQGIPVLIDDVESIFKTNDILKNKPTTQDAQYRKKSFRTVVRQKLLPSLSQDFNMENRYTTLAEAHSGCKVLVIGAGDKITWYNEIFKDALVITTDVHLQFNPDLVVDAHQIPFKDSSFDLVIAGQVLEHTFKPWVVAQEIERVCKTDGTMLIEVPFNFPYHGAPYDFFRFTFTGLRSLFPKSELIATEVAEGNASAVATYNSQFLIDAFSHRFLRSTMLFVSRILFGWMKYLDKNSKKVNLRTISIPKGFSMTFKKDNKQRSNSALLEEYKLLHK